MAKKQQLTEEDNFKNWSYDASLDNEAKDAKIGDAIADAFVSDNPYMALLDIGTMGTLGGVGGKGMIRNFLTKSPKGRRLVEKIPFLSKLTEKVVSPKNKGFDFDKVKDFNKTVQSEIKASGLMAEGVSSTPAWSKGVTNYGDAGKDAISGALINMKETGKYLDEIGFKASEMSGKNIVFHGTKYGRSIVEIALPNGKTQLMYKSSGLANKAGGGAGGTTEGLWQPYGGHATNSGTKNWFIKDEGYKDFYGSKSFRDIAGNLDRIAAEEGWDLSKQILKNK